MEYGAKVLSPPDNKSSPKKQVSFQVRNCDTELRDLQDSLQSMLAILQNKTITNIFQQAMALESSEESPESGEEDLNHFQTFCDIQNRVLELFESSDDFAAVFHETGGLAAAVQLLVSESFGKVFCSCLLLEFLEDVSKQNAEMLADSSRLVD